MRPNPLLMTVMGNPCHSNGGYQSNPFVLVDSQTNKIIRTWRGSMTDRKPWDWAADAARRLGRPVFVVAHPYVPPTFRAGVEVSPLFYAGGGFQEVRPDGSVGRAPSFGYKRNSPGFFPSMAGGIAGTLVANAIANPHSGSADPHAARELELYIKNDADLYRQQFVPIVKNLMKRRSKGTYDRELAVKLFMYLVDNGARKYVREFGTRGQKIDAMFNRSTRLEVARSLRDSFETEAGLGNYDRMTWGVSNNPASRRAQRFMSREVSHLMRDRGYPQKRAVAAAYSVARAKGYKLNGRRRKVTMTLQKFAKWLKAKGDPRLWADFIKKIKGYQKWTHGSLPKNVTLEVIDKPGVSGLWITYDAGTAPESAYVMPKGSKRKGAWKHPWDTPPRIKHDAEAGIIMHKIGGKSRITDFYHL